MFLTHAEALKSVLADFQKTFPEAADHWEEWVRREHGRAYRDIADALTDQGYSQTQIDAWDRGADYEDCLTRWYVLQRAASTSGNYQLPAEPPPCVVWLADAWIIGVEPEDTTSGACAVGDLKADSDFFHLDPCDPRTRGNDVGGYYDLR